MAFYSKPQYLFYRFCMCFSLDGFIYKCCFFHVFYTFLKKKVSEKFNRATILLPYGSYLHLKTSTDTQTYRTTCRGIPVDLLVKKIQVITLTYRLSSTFNLISSRYVRCNVNVQVFDNSQIPFKMIDFLSFIWSYLKCCNSKVLGSASI